MAGLLSCAWQASGGRSMKEETTPLSTADQLAMRESGRGEGELGNRGLEGEGGDAHTD